MRISDWSSDVCSSDLAFAILYTTITFPIARLAERHNRITIISLAFSAWSIMTALCGLAGSFVQLLLCRAGVSVGEAGCTPPSHSLISDYFPPERRMTAISIYAVRSDEHTSELQS